MRALRKSHIACLAAVVLLIAAISAEIPVIAREPNDRKIHFELQLPEETGDSERLVAVMKLFIPAGVELRGFSTGLVFPVPYFECTAESIVAGSAFSRDCIGGAKETVTFQYENAYSPLTAGEYTLFAVQFALRADTPEGRYSLQTVTKEAYTSVLDSNGIYVGSQDVEWTEATGSVYVGTRFRVEPASVELEVGHSMAVEPNKALAGVYVQNTGIAQYCDGAITGLSAGYTYAVFEAETGEAVTVKITVIQPGSEPEPLPKITSELFTVSETGISGVSAEMSVEAFLAGFPDGRFLAVYRADGRTPVQAYEKIGTGCIVKLFVDGREADSKQVTVTGDVNGDGRITAADYVNVKFSVLGKQALTGVYSSAADVNRDGRVTASDYVYIKFHVLGKVEILP